MEDLKALSPPRGDDCPSDLALAEYETDVLPEARRSHVAEHLGRCARCRGLLEEGRAAFDALPAQEHDEIIASMLRTGFGRPDSVSLRAVARWAPVLMAAAAAAVVVTMVFVPRTERPDTTPKGRGVALGVYRERGGQVAKALAGDTFQARDRLRFSIDLTEPAHVMIVGVEQGGALYPCAPHARVGAVSRPAGAGQILEDTIELDDSEGRETLELIACPEPFTFADVERRPRTDLAPDPRCRVSGFALEKRRP